MRSSSLNLPRSSHQHSSMRTTQPRMRTTLFDQVTSLLMSLILLLGCGVAVLLVLWAFTAAAERAPHQPHPISRVSFSNHGNTEIDFEVPTPAETQSLNAPTLAETIAMVSQVPVSDLVSHDTSLAATVQGDPLGTKESGDGVDGDHIDGENAIARFQRWQIIFRASSADDYARQLDDLGIELAVFGGGAAGIDCLTNLSLSPSPERYHIESPKHERRLYFSWIESDVSASLIAYEKQWFAAAGITTQNRHLIKFVPADLESQLAQSELEYAREHDISSVDQIAATVFESRPHAGGFQLHVIRQRYRKTR